MAKEKRVVSSEDNEKTDQERWEDQKFLDGYGEVKKLESDMAGLKGDLNAVYKRLKDMGFSKKEVEFAKSLEDKDIGQVIADFQRKIRIAKLFGHSLGRQLNLLDDDPTPKEERAYQAGVAAGRLRKQVSNPYTPGTREFERWEDGIRDGNQIVNQELAKAMEPDPV